MILADLHGRKGALKRETRAGLKDANLVVAIRLLQDEVALDSLGRARGVGRGAPGVHCFEKRASRKAWAALITRTTEVLVKHIMDNLLTCKWCMELVWLERVPNDDRVLRTRPATFILVMARENDVRGQYIPTSRRATTT